MLGLASSVHYVLFTECGALFLTGNKFPRLIKIKERKKERERERERERET
jgi:hypothetical protein